MKEDWVVVIPSYNRVETLKEKTLKVLQDYKIPPSKIYVFVANEEQKELYEAGLEKGSVGHIVVGVKGLAEVRNFIFKYFPKGKHIVEMDDDIRGFIEYDEKAKRHEKPLKNFVEICNRGFAEAKKAGARLWGVYSVPNGFFMKPTVTTDLRFIIGSFWGCINPGEEIQIPLGSEKEDYQRTILFWEKDGAVVRLNFVAPKTAYYKEPGGMQEGNRIAKQNKTVKSMLKRWPQYIQMNPRRKSGYPEIRLTNTTKKVKKVTATTKHT
uniref:Glycosyltransferase n=1 Tax=viral metagenome TaxID=1070528 RepID=A0A6C0KMG2_9ZZZZ